MNELCRGGCGQVLRLERVIRASMSGRMHDMQDEFDVATPINKYKQQCEQEGGFHRVHPRIHNGVAIE